jgi:hypothetical protein
MRHALPKLFIVLIFVLVAVGFYLADQQQNTAVIPSNPKPGDTASAMVIKEAYRQQAHHYTGTLMAPDPCVSLKTDIVLEQSKPEKITLSLALGKDGKCKARAPGKKDFVFVVPSSEDAQLASVLVDGQPVNFTLAKN